MTGPSAELDPFKAFEKAGWEGMDPARYEATTGSVTAQVIDPLLDAVHAEPGVRLLDIACGTGQLVAAAHDRGCAAVGIDFSTSMLAWARQRYAFLQFEHGDAEALPFPDMSFAAVTINAGLLHVPRPELVLTEAFRVLRSGGRIGFTAWAGTDNLLMEAIRAHGTLDVPLPPGPPPGQFSTAEESARALRVVGFINPETVQVSLIRRVASVEEMLNGLLTGTVRVAAILRAQTPAAREAIRVYMREALIASKNDGFIEAPSSMMLSSAHKPA